VAARHPPEGLVSVRAGEDQRGIIAAIMGRCGTGDNPLGRRPPASSSCRPVHSRNCAVTCPHRRWPCPHSCTTRNESLSGQDSKLCLAFDGRGRRGRRAHEVLRRQVPSRPAAHGTRTSAETIRLSRCPDRGLMPARCVISLAPAAPNGTARGGFSVGGPLHPV
jgi:hypothetical protein